MDARKLPWLELSVLGIALVVLVLGAGGGPGWGAASAHATIATRFDRSAAAPLYDVLASIAALVPAGEPGFRLGLLAAVLGAATLAGVVAAARALVPREPLAGLAGAVLLALAPPFREAAASATPALLAACGATWAIAFAACPRGPRDAAAALVGCAAVAGSAPWLGAALTILVVARLARAQISSALLAAGVAALGLGVAALWWDALGRLPDADGSLAAAIAATGRGAGAVVVGAGLLGVGFGALTGLRGARWLLAFAALAAGHEVLAGGTAPVVLALFAVGVAIVPSALVRAGTPAFEGVRRHAVTLAAALPLIAAAVATGATLRPEDPGAVPARLASDLVDALPAGPGVVVATRATSWYALAYEQAIAGLRPDLALAPPAPPEQADVIAADALRAGRIVGADAAAFGRLDVQRALPRGRGFQLLGTLPARAVPVEPPARYATEIGREQATLLALERARFEAANGRLDAAARAAGLVGRFGAADLAVLATTRPTKQRPALFGFLPPLDHRPAGPWLLDVFGDDLAWVAGLAEPPLADDAPAMRRLHARWRAIFLGKATADDSQIAELGDAAVRATRVMLDALHHY